MPKKKQYNSFYFYMKEKQEILSKQGRKLPMAEIANIAGPEWKKLSAAEKEKYERMVIQYKDQQRDYIGSKLASDGTLIQENLQLEEEEKQKDKRMYSAVKDLITSYSRNKDLLARESFYVISFNILCCTEDEDFIPVEIGVLEYSIQEGLSRHYHKFISPGTIPTGYTGEAKRHSEATHQIPINGHETADQNYQRILQELKKFLDPSEANILPPLFCLNADIDQTVGCLRWLAEKSGQLCDVEIFKIWDLKYLLMELREVTENGISQYLAHDLLHKNNFDYTPDTRCPYHEELDISYCALGAVRRLCFLLSDALCGVFGVEVTEKHLPVRAQEAKSYEMHIPLAQTLNRNPETSRGIGRGLRPSFTRKAFSDETSHPGRQPVTQAPLMYSTGRNNAENEREQLVSPPQPVSFSPVSLPQSRQPQTPSLAQEMGKLNLTDSVRGLGIGRGLVKKQ